MATVESATVDGVSDAQACHVIPDGLENNLTHLLRKKCVGSPLRYRLTGWAGQGSECSYFLVSIVNV